ncbi:MAG TPA: aldose epimerase [Opitutus sp.]|nr:aldose epimerase [Opitutus sp.]
MEKITYLGETITRWTVGQSTFLALPEKGARLMNWNVTLGDGSIRDVIYWPELASLDNFHHVRGGNPVLFPFCGRTFDHGDINFWRAPGGERRPMPQHGIARQGKFKLLASDQRGFSAQFEPGAEARAAYPFDYEFTVTYRLESLGFACEFTLKNLGAAPLPWCAGHHFYFTLPWSEGAVRNDYLIRIPAAQRFRQDSRGQIVPGPELARDESVADPALIDTLHGGLLGNEVVFGERGRSGDVAVRLGTTKKPPADAVFVTWTPDEKAPYFCVEPWMGPPNAPEHKRGLAWVAPGATGSFTVAVNLR